MHLRAGVLVLVVGIGGYGCGDSGPTSSNPTLGRSDAQGGAAPPGSINQPPGGGGGGASGAMTNSGGSSASGGGGGALGGPQGGNPNGGASGANVDAGPLPEVPPPPPADVAPPAEVPTSAAVPPEIDGRLVINEIMASNALTLKDEAGMTGDWVEFFNPTNQNVPLGGYSITNDLNVSKKAVIPAGLVVPAGGHLLLWLDEVAGGGQAHVLLKLEEEGGTIGLARPDGSFITRLAYGPQETDFSAARAPDGSDAWVIEWHPSPGKANPAGAGRPLAPAAAGAPPEPVPAAGDLSEKLLGYDAIADLRIDVTPADSAKLLADPLTYVPATLTFAGRAYGPVGVRLKGHNSFEPFDRKPSLKVAVDKIFPNARFFGLKDLTLNNMHSDPSMMHERIAYWVARTAGIPASRASHALLSINGKPPALYMLVETVKHKMLNRWFKMPDGALYEATNVDFTTADTDYVPPRDDIPFFELVGKVDDRTMLYGLANALAVPNPDQAIAGAAGHINLAQFQTFWAMCALVGQFDSMPYSIPGDDYFVYNNPEDKKVYVIPWGMDETFEASDVDVVGRVYSVMARTCKASPACMAQFADKAWALLEKMESMNWLLEHARVAQQIAAHTSADQQKSYNDAAVKLGQDDMRFFMADRRVWFTKFLPPRNP